MPSKIILIGPPIMPQKIKLFTAVCGASLKFQGFFHVGSAFDAWHWLLTLDLTNFVWIRPISAEANDGPKQSSGLWCLSSGRLCSLNSNFSDDPFKSVALAALGLCSEGNKIENFCPARQEVHFCNWGRGSRFHPSRTIFNRFCVDFQPPLLPIKRCNFSLRPKYMMHCSCDH